LVPLLRSSSYALVLRELQKINANLAQFIKLVLDLRRPDNPEDADEILREKNSHSALSLEEAPSSVSISLAMRWMRMPAHCAPSRWPGSPALPKQGDHAQFLQQNRIEGHLIQPVENL
jgi:hypothetical protein